MRGHVAFLSGVFLALAFPSAASAAQIISSGTYGANTGGVIVGGYSQKDFGGPLPKGWYRYDLEVSTPIFDLHGGVWDSHYTYHSELWPDGTYIISMDDNFSVTNKFFTKVNTYLYTATTHSIEFRSTNIYEQNGTIYTMIDEGKCCGVYLSFDSNQAGHYTLSLTSLSAVPEPMTWAMLNLGFAALGVSLRSSRRRRLAAQPAAL